MHGNREIFHSKLQHIKNISAFNFYVFHAFIDFLPALFAHVHEEGRQEKIGTADEMNGLLAIFHSRSKHCISLATRIWTEWLR